MVRFIEKSELTACEREACRALYKEGFPEDSDEYLEWFLTNKEYTVALNDGATSALYLVPKKIRMYGAILDVKYVVAFSAAKSARGTGAAQEVMRSSIERERGLGTPFLFLSPFNYEYYKQYGFVTVDRELTAVDRPQYERREIADKAEGGRIMAEVRRIIGDSRDMAQIADERELSNSFEEEIVGGARFYGLILSGGETYGYEFEARGRVYERFTVSMRRTRRPHVQARIASYVSALSAVRYLKSDFNAAFTIRDGEDYNRIELSATGGETKVRLKTADGASGDAIDVSELTAAAIGESRSEMLGELFPRCSTVMFDRY